MSPLSPRRVAAQMISLALSCAFFAIPSLADEQPSLLDVLLENGSITKEQYDALSADGDVQAAERAGDAIDALPPVSAGQIKPLAIRPIPVVVVVPVPLVTPVAVKISDLLVNGGRVGVESRFCVPSPRISGKASGTLPE